MGISVTPRPSREALRALAVQARLTGAGRFFVPVAKTSVPVLRADDLVVLSIAWTGLDLAVADGVAVLRAADGRSGILVAHFQPQHVDEEAIWETAPQLGDVLPKDPKAAQKAQQAGPNADTIAESRLAAPSRLAFDVPVGWGPITYTVEGILDALGRLPLRVHPGSQRLRLVVRELEVLRSDREAVGSRDPERSRPPARRIVYLETIEI